MAYKFQVGAARLSGSTVFEESLSTLKSFGAETLSSSAGLQVGGTVELDGVVDVTAAPASDSFYILDATDGLMKRESMSSYATTIAGDGLAAASGVLKVDVSDFAGTGLEDDGSENLRIAAAAAGSGLGGGGGSALSVNVDDSSIEINSDSLRIKAEGVTDAMLNDDVATGLAGTGLDASGGVMALDLHELTAAVLASGDFLSFVDSNDSNKTRKESIDDIATLFAGAGLDASSAVLSVQVSGALKVASDKVGISGSFAGDGLKFLGGADSISSIELDIKELPAGSVADGDFFAFVDATDNSTKKEAVADLATLFAGTGLAASSAVLSVDLNELGAAAVNVGADSIAIIDADDSNGSKKETIADLMTAVAGDGLAASSGVLAVGVDDSSIETSGDALRVKASGVTNAMLAGSIADSKLNQITTGDKVAGSAVQLAGTSALEDSTGLRLKDGTAGVGLAIASQVLSVDLNELSAATVDVANDSIAIIDANDSNGSKKESIADLVGAMAGAGLAAASGQLRVPSSEVSIQDYRSNFNASVGVNAPDTNAMGGAITVTMPDPLAVAGAKVIIKAPASCTSTNTVTISGATIDGQSSIVLEGPGAAVTLINVDVGGDSWIIV